MLNRYNSDYDRTRDNAKEKKLYPYHGDDFYVIEEKMDRGHSYVIWKETAGSRDKYELISSLDRTGKTFTGSSRDEVYRKYKAWADDYWSEMNDLVKTVKGAIKKKK